MDVIQIKNFPIPPTSNQMYASFRGRLIKSKLNRLYDLKVAKWAMENQALVQEIKAKFTGMQLQVDCKFVFQVDKVFTKKKDLKKMDHTNRIKAAHDALSKIIEIDDSHFIYTPCEKMWCFGEQDEQIVIEISEYKIRGYL